MLQRHVPKNAQLCDKQLEMDETKIDMIEPASCNKCMNTCCVRGSGHRTVGVGLLDDISNCSVGVAEPALHIADRRL